MATKFDWKNKRTWWTGGWDKMNPEFVAKIEKEEERKSKAGMLTICELFGLGNPWKEEEKKRK